MQAETNVEPRKLNIPGDKCLSVAELETVPLKKRLEILFIANIIPSRRQLAFKYGLDEQLIHNVLSHRSYILQNWKYNANTERLLTKSELENAMAFMELLIEWKRRVELNGLQMTHAALIRKTLALQKILKANALKLSENWWQLFNENWEHKQFRDNENDSLEFEDILNDLQWMFAENTFNRLAIRLRCARGGGRTRIKREKTKGDGDGLCIDDEEDSNEPNELLDVSEIKTEPLYYNDDEFDCEDYEFVLDEELVCDSLRRELADAETAKYQRFMGTDNAEFLFAAEEEKTEDTEEIVQDVEEDEIETKADIIFEELQENSNFFTNTLTPPESIDPLWSMIDRKVPVPIRLEIVNPAAASIVEEPPKVTPKPFRRRPRNVHAVLTVRKDYVRLPAPTEVANFATKKFVPQEIDEDANESEEDYDEMFVQKPTRRRRKQSKASQQKKTCLSRSPSPQMSTVFEDDNDVGNEQLTESVEPRMMPILTSDKSTVDPPTTTVNTELGEFSCLLKVEEDSVPYTGEKTISSSKNTQRNKDITNKKTRSSNLKTVAKNFKVDDDEGELILGIPSSLGQSDEVSRPESSPRPQILGERRKQKFKDKLKITSVQILDGPASKDDDVVDEKKPQVQLQQIVEKQKVEHGKKTSAKSSTKNAVKRVKRRTDDSDLTLRRDKVRIGLATVPVTNRQSENISH